MLEKPFGNNYKNKIKYFECEDGCDYFIKADSKTVIPYNERIFRWTAQNIELIIDFWMNHDEQIAKELIVLIASFFGAKDG